MTRTRGPCKCKWCPGEAIPRAGLVQVCPACQVKIDRIVRATREDQLRGGLSDPVIAARFGVVTDTWRRIRRRLEEFPNDELVCASIDPTHRVGAVAAGAPTEPHTSDGPWEQRAACREAPPEIFFPASRKDTRTITQALTFCGGCEVRGICHRNAGDHGIWGGQLFSNA